MVRKLFLSLSLIFASLPIFAQEPTVDVTSFWDGIKVPVFRVSVSGDEHTKTYASRALAMHGSFNLVQSGAQYEFSFQKASENSVTLTIKGATPFTQTVEGHTLPKAVEKACDVIVQKIFGSKGFYAGELVFASDRTGRTEIYTSDLLFSSVKALTSDNSDSMLPHWSADGSKVIYTGYFRTKLMDLYEIDLTTGTRKVFASYKGSNTGGAASPDGRYTALTLTTTGNAEIWRVNANGTGFKRLTKNKAVEASASWSPDSSTLIFSSDQMGSPQIYKMSAEGGAMTRIQTNASNYCTEPAWNPVYPNLIAFTAAVRGAGSTGFQIYVYDMSAKKGDWITNGGSSTMPKWTSDGRHLIFTKNFGKNRSIYLVDSATKKQTVLHSEKMGNCGEADFIYKY